MLVESIVLGREVVWINVACDELEELERVVRLAAGRFENALALAAVVGLESLPRAAFDHVWLVNVLTDPDHSPALHDELYERRGTELATARGTLTADRERVEELASSALALAADGALLSTTVEELAVLGPLCRSRGRRMRPLVDEVETAIVGDALTLYRYASADDPAEPDQDPLRRSEAS